jgi:hypothetical protein
MFSHYDPSKYDPYATFEIPPEGEHLLTVESAERATSRRGNDMIKAVFSVGGYRSRVFHYFVDSEYVQHKLDPFFASFGIAPGDFRLEGWGGRSGMAMIRHEDYDGKAQPKVRFFIVSDAAGETQRPQGQPQAMPSASGAKGGSPDGGDYPLSFSDGDGDDDGWAEASGDVPF